MRILWAPWRIKYILSPKRKKCFLCEAAKSNNDEENLVVFRGYTCFVILNRYPYNNGHLMIATYRHVGDLAELNMAELFELNFLAQLALRALRRAMKPDGFNIGLNLGKVAGAGVKDHIHVHVVPRWEGDTNFMPVLAETKVIPEALDSTYKKLKKEFGALSGEFEKVKPIIRSLS